MLADPPGKKQVSPLLLGRLLLRDHVHGRAVLEVAVPVLHEHPAEHSSHIALADVALPLLCVLDDADVRLRLKYLQHAVAVAGREQKLDEVLVELLCKG